MRRLSVQPAQPAISVVCATYNRAALLPRLVSALDAQDTHHSFEVHIVDNGSSDETTQVLRELARGRPALHVHRLDVNRGPAPARNVAWRFARAPVVAFTDDDCVPDVGWLAGLLAAVGQGADIVEGVTLADPDRWASRGTFSHWMQVLAWDPSFPTCNIAYRRDVLIAAGGFDETFEAIAGLAWGEDTDLGWRCVELGARTAFADDAVVVHDITDSSYRAWLRARMRRAGTVSLVRRHPGFRAVLPRPWLLDASHGHALTAAIGIGVSGVRLARGRPATTAAALVLVVPYVHHRLYRHRLPGRRVTWPVVLPAQLVADLWETAVVSVTAARQGTILI